MLNSFPRYIFEKYGTERTAMVSNQVFLQSRSAIREVAKVYGLSNKEILEVTKRIGWYPKRYDLLQWVKTDNRFKNVDIDETEEEFSKRMGKNLEDLILKEDPETIAGFFAEPVMGAGGVVPPSKGYFDIIQPILKKYNIPFIADEVICGFGRTGNLWGSQTYNINPDMIIASKCITAGYFPMGAVILRQEFADEFVEVSEEAEEFPHGFTSGGHPVGCAIALKAIDVITKEGLLDNVKAISPYFTNKLREFNKYENIGEIRAVGLMGALEIVKDKISKSPFDTNISIGEKVANMSIENGLICRPIGSSIVLCPQFIITESQLDTLFDILHKTLKKTFEIKQ